MIAPVPTVCVYHFPCADGFSAAWAVWKRFGDSVRFLEGQHGEHLPLVSFAGQDVLFADFSYKRPYMEEIIKAASSVTVLDHHKSAEADVGPFIKNSAIHGIFDMERSGAVLAWNWCHPNEPVPKLLEYVQDRDLWRFNLRRSREVSACIFSHEYKFVTWSLLASVCEDIDGLADLIIQGSAILRKQDKDIQELLVATTREMKIGSAYVPVANLPYTLASDACHILAKDQPFAASYYDGTDARHFSLRSEKGSGWDVSEIARSYGGGGHFHAAGFQRELGWEGEQ